MIVLKKKTYDRILKAVIYPSITGGRGVRATRMPGGGVRIDLEGPNDGGGIGWDGPPPIDSGMGGSGGPQGTVHSANGPMSLPVSPTP